MNKTYDYNSFTEDQAKRFAEDNAAFITVRVYSSLADRGTDSKRESNDVEKQMLTRAVFSALLAVREGFDVSACLASAEYFAQLEPLDDGNVINATTSVYWPVMEFLKEKKARP